MKKTSVKQDVPESHQIPSEENIRVIIAGGGTGGHLFPGIAVAEEFIKRNENNRILFVSTGNTFEKTVLGKSGFELKQITVEGIKGRSFGNQFRSLMKTPLGILNALRIIHHFNPDLVFGVGSYSAGPVVLAAWFMRKKIVLHEQNILPGVTNRILGRIAHRIYISFRDTQAKFNPEKTILTGNPLRRSILECIKESDPPEMEKENKKKVFTVMIIGGSQGAHKINMAVMDALAVFGDKTEYHFIHQTGENDQVAVSEAYEKHNVSATVGSFFSNMKDLYQQTDLMICRAGATTVAEVTAIGKCAIFIPFPFAADNHQFLNAQALIKSGAADMIDESELNGKILAEKLDYFRSQPKILKTMAAAAKKFGKPDAAVHIVDACLELLDRPD